MKKFIIAISVLLIIVISGYEYTRLVSKEKHEKETNKAVWENEIKNSNHIIGAFGYKFGQVVKPAGDVYFIGSLPNAVKIDGFTNQFAWITPKSKKIHSIHGSQIFDDWNNGYQKLQFMKNKIIKKYGEPSDLFDRGTVPPKQADVTLEYSNIKVSVQLIKTFRKGKNRFSLGIVYVDCGLDDLYHKEKKELNIGPNHTRPSQRLSTNKK